MRPLFCEFVYTRNIGQPCKCNVAVATPDGTIKDACQSYVKVMILLENSIGGKRASPARIFTV